MSKWVVVFAALAACSSPRPPAVAPTAPMDLLQHVPADTPYLLHLSRGLLASVERGPFTRDQLLGELRRDLESALIEPDQLAKSIPRLRLRSELARELLPLDAAALARAGWFPGRSELVVYGWGLAPVIRARLDGALALATVTRAAKRAGVPLRLDLHAGLPYLEVPSRREGGPMLVVLFHPQQIAAGLSRDPATILPHLANLSPASPSLASDRGAFPRDPHPDEGAVFAAAVSPPRLAAAMQAPAGAVLLGDRHAPPCLARVVDLIETLPPMSVDFTAGGPEVSYSYIVGSWPALAPLLATATGVQRWSTDPPADLQLAVGFEPGSLVPVIEHLWSERQAIAAACGDTPAPPLQLGPQLGALASVTGGSLVADDAGTAIHLGAVVDTRDPAALWGLLARVLPLGDMRELEPSKITQVGTVNGLPAYLGHDAETLYAGLGSPDRTVALGKVAAVQPQPDLLFRVVMSGELLRRLRAGELSFFGLIEPAPPEPVLTIGVEVRRDGDVLVLRHSGRER